jgi:hypothetical protein
VPGRAAPHDRGQTHDGSNGQVDSAGRDHKRHSDRNDTDDGRVSNDRQEIVDVGEPVAGRHRADDDEHEQGDDEAEVAADRPAEDALHGTGALGLL